jgi:ATP phosphoribosyltransferase
VQVLIVRYRRFFDDEKGDSYMPMLKMVVPKGRLFGNVVELLNDAGFGVEVDQRIYTPMVDDPEIEAKIMKPQNIPQLVEFGSHDVGFTGQDWIVETQAHVVDMMDLEFDPVRIVAAAPAGLDGSDLRSRRILVASEYERISREFLEGGHYDYVLLRTYGATEVFPPEDADMIVDNLSTGRTLQEHNLRILTTIMESSTRFIANEKALEDQWKKEKIGEMQMLFRSVLDARERVMLEMNVSEEDLDRIVDALPCMRAPTVAPLYNQQGYAVKAAVPQREVARLIPQLKRLGATDILEFELRKVVA